MIMQGGNRVNKIAIAINKKWHVILNAIQTKIMGTP